MKIPKEWTFKSKDIAKGFDHHVREQLPWYDIATFVCVHYIRALAREEAVIYDLGCSTGNLEVSCSEIIRDRDLCWVPVDNSWAMIEKYRGKTKPVHCPLEKFSPALSGGGAICFLSLMFLTKKDRGDLLRRLSASLGWLIIFDKFIPEESDYLSVVGSKLSLAIKMAYGISAQEILDKELSLVGSQWPMQMSEIERYNPRQIFKLGEFEGYVIEFQH